MSESFPTSLSEYNRHYCPIWSVFCKQKKEIEFWYFSILEKYQNCGIGKKITKNVVDELSGVCKLHARCSQNSKQMIKILKLYGFKETGENKKGYKFFYL